MFYMRSLGSLSISGLCCLVEFGEKVQCNAYCLKARLEWDAYEEEDVRTNLFPTSPGLVVRYLRCLEESEAVAYREFTTIMLWFVNSSIADDLAYLFVRDPRTRLLQLGLLAKVHNVSYVSGISRGFGRIPT
ncbi:hypothetical protein AVEN_117193-1 [Araneus ventricosus]|uniref:Uncharacterized protein n=1 Tax=Araneus ventricosus TaxID=182803 RepID=A0A4Y2AWK0_ARAVE|nr:hypothetical protein AVEN_117193-1 [Araneus ventricosus]